MRLIFRWPKKYWISARRSGMVRQRLDAAAIFRISLICVASSKQRFYMRSFHPVIENIHDHLVHQRCQQAEGGPGHQCGPIGTQLARAVHWVAKILVEPFYLEIACRPPQKQVFIKVGIDPDNLAGRHVDPQAGDRQNETHTDAPNLADRGPGGNRSLVRLCQQAEAQAALKEQDRSDQLIAIPGFRLAIFRDHRLRKAPFPKSTKKKEVTDQEKRCKIIEDEVVGPAFSNQVVEHVPCHDHYQGGDPA